MPQVRFDWRMPHHWLAFGLGAGLVPRIPGTAGTLVAVPLYLLLSPLPVVVYLAVVAGLGAVGIWACGKVAAELGQEDPRPVVWDEVVGYLVTMAAAPVGWIWIIVGFLSFRLFDILKPWPIRDLERRLKGGLGIMLDDLVAGAMAWAVLRVLARGFG